MTDTTDDTPLDPFEIISSPWGDIERWCASTLSTGAMGDLAQVYETVRADAAQLEERKQEIEARKDLVQRLCSAVADLQERVNRFADALELKHREDEAERERQLTLDE